MQALCGPCLGVAIEALMSACVTEKGPAVPESRERCPFKFAARLTVHRSAKIDDLPTSMTVLTEALVWIICLPDLKERPLVVTDQVEPAIRNWGVAVVGAFGTSVGAIFACVH